MLVTHGHYFNGGRNVHWNFKSSKDAPVNFGSQESPFGLKTEKKPVSTQNAVITFVRMGLNRSASMGFRGYCPTLEHRATHRVTKNLYNGREFFLSGSQHTYNFITSDEAQQVESAYKSIVAPHGCYVWVTVFTAPAIIMILAKLATNITNRPERLSMQFNLFYPLFAFYTALLDQPHIVNRSGFSRTLITSWLLGAFTLSTEYKNYLKSQFVADVYAVRWTKLEQLKNFTVYIPV